MSKASPESRPELRDSGRAELTPMALVIDPNHLITSFVDSFDRFPEGKSSWLFDRANRSLMSLELNVSEFHYTRNMPSRAVGIEKDGNFLLIADPWSLNGNLLNMDSTYLRMELGDRSHLQHAEFNSPLYTNPHLHFGFKSEGSQLKGSGHIFQTLVHPISLFSFLIIEIILKFLS